MIGITRGFIVDTKQVFRCVLLAQSTYGTPFALVAYRYEVYGGGYYVC